MDRASPRTADPRRRGPRPPASGGRAPPKRCRAREGTLLPGGALRHLRLERRRMRRAVPAGVRAQHRRGTRHAAIARNPPKALSPDRVYRSGKRAEFFSVKESSDNRSAVVAQADPAAETK